MYRTYSTFILNTYSLLTIANEMFNIPYFFYFIPTFDNWFQLITYLHIYLIVHTTPSPNTSLSLMMMLLIDDESLDNKRPFKKMFLKFFSLNSRSFGLFRTPSCTLSYGTVCH